MISWEDEAKIEKYEKITEISNDMEFIEMMELYAKIRKKRKQMWNDMYDEEKRIEKLLKPVFEKGIWTLPMA